MHVGMMANFQNPGRQRPDRAVYEEDLRLVDLAEGLGFQSIWATEHHFTDYIMSPSPLQFLAYAAGRTRHALLGTMVVVLPWHDPLRVAEELCLLDHLSGGRAIFGMGRGAGRIEFEGFRLDMGESRERFVEAAQAILPAIETGIMAHEGAHYRQPRVALRPQPFKTFRGRTYAAAVSPESARIMARLGVGILVVPQKPWAECEREHREYRAIFREVNGRDAPQPICAGWVFVDEDERRAHDEARRWIGNYYRSVLAHYEFAGQHMKTTKGYEYYGKIADRIGKHGEESFVDFFMDLQVWGTPEQCCAKILEVQSRLGSCGFIGSFAYGGMPAAEAERNIRLFARSVLPEIRRFDAGGAL